ncbi:MAG TPA: alginate lyase family protein [Clostridia bacterium]|nr:alginate lyase family protein [Clostridia bacterium]
MLLRLCREGPPRNQRGLAADIKLIWDYSRAQPLVTNAAAGPAQLEACAAFVSRWLEANTDTNGPAWSCAMDIAIRAVNWIFADVLFQGQLAEKVGREIWDASLWRHGWLIWRRLEARLVGSNHYLSNLLGLLVIGSVFPEEPRARFWAHFAHREFSRALLTQTRPDGGLHEASLRYHAFVTEMALLFRLAQNSAFPAAAEKRLSDMCQIVADFRDASGDVFALGDDDSGRVLAVDFASPLGRAEILLRLASSLLQRRFESRAEGVYRDSGWWVRRTADFTAVMEFGGVGLCGRGGHAHNDDLSFCLDWGGKPVIVDPGSFLYTSDRDARNRFRSTFAHNTLVVDGQEQRELIAEPFSLVGSDQAFAAKQLEPAVWEFFRPLAGGVTHRRAIEVRRQEISIRDLLEGTGSHELKWHFHLHPSVKPRLESQGFELTVPGVGTLTLSSPSNGLALEILPAEYAPEYGHNQPTLACSASWRGPLPISLQWEIRPVS